MIEDVTIHMMVKNESPYIIQTLRSVIPFVRNSIIIDTGSTDDTVGKIGDFFHYYESVAHNQNQGFNHRFLQRDVAKDSIEWDGNHLNQELTDLRNEMLSITDTSWVWQVDGDEIYTPDSIIQLSKIMPMLEGTPYIGLQHLIKWCISDEQYVLPGPFPQTLRVFTSNGFWQGQFPDEYLWVDNKPIHMGDPRCITAGTVEFLHMSMALHPERRPPNGNVGDLTEEEKQCLIF
jgi:glycosyltransferase involved in cell wall biosynthesis